MKTKRMLSVLLPALLMAGCLISGTFSIKIELNNIETAFVNGIVSETVNLSDESEDWADHADKIERIESVNFDAIITNVLTTTETLSVYVSAVSTYSTAAQVLGAADAYPVLANYASPGSAKDTLTVVEAQALLQLSGANFTAVKNLLKTGAFTVYVASTGTEFQGSIAEANIYITFTASE